MEGYDSSTYGDRFADVYDDWYADVSDVEGTVALIVELAGDAPVLELGVGTGRIALPLAAAGLEVVGIDASAAMVERLRSKPGGPDLRVEVGDFAAALPHVEGGYGAVVVTFNTLLNLVAPGAAERCLSLVHDALRPGGAFVCEAFVPADELAVSGVEVRRVLPGEVVFSVFRRDGEVVTGSLVSLTETGGVRLRPWSVRPLTPEQLDGLASDAGQALEARHGGWRGEPFDEGSDRYVSTYRRAAVPSRAVMGP
jgi:SAM-dependent methyltransferase